MGFLPELAFSAQEFDALRAVGAVAATYGAWRLARAFFGKSTLANIPGPPNPSWLQGERRHWLNRHVDLYLTLSGHIYDLFSLRGWEFHHSLVEKYGGVVKINSFFGVRVDPFAS